MKPHVPLCPVLLLFACCLAGPAWAQVIQDERPQRNGFVFSASLGLAFGLQVQLTTQGNETASAAPALLGGLALGGKVGRVVLTIGAEFNNLSFSSSTGSTTSMSQSSSNFLIVPGVQVAIVRSHDGRVELLGAARFGFGEPVTSTSQNPPANPPPPTSSTTQFNFMYEVAPGVRYWPHRHFALNLLAGFRGDYRYEFVSASSTSSATTNTVGLNGIFASIGGMGVF